MKMSDSIANLAAAMAKAQASMGHVVKDKVGKIQTKSGSGYEYKYSDLASVIESVKSALNENGITFIQSPSGDATGVTVTTMLLHTSGEWMQDTLYMPVGQGTPQAYGSAITYCKRYQLQSMTGLPSEDDDGAKASEKEADRKPRDVAAIVAASGNGADVNKDAFNGLDAETQKYLKDMAMEVLAVHEDKGDLHGWVERQNFNDEEKMGLWSLLPANVRRAIKDSQRAAMAARKVA